MYEERIVVNPEIMVGKPVVRGTRIPVAIVLEHLAANLDLDALYLDYPSLTPEDVRACVRYAAAVVAGEEALPAPVTHREPAHARA